MTEKIDWKQEIILSKLFNQKEEKLLKEEVKSHIQGIWVHLSMSYRRRSKVITHPSHQSKVILRNVIKELKRKRNDSYQRGGS